MTTKILVSYMMVALIFLFSCTSQQPAELTNENQLLGDYFQFSLSSENLNHSLDFYRKLQFEIISINENASPPWALLSDGSNLIMLSQNSFPSPALTFFGENLEDRLNMLKSKGIYFESVYDDKQQVKSAVLKDSEYVGISVINYQSRKLPRPTSTHMTILGNFDKLIIPSGAVEKSVEFWKKVGFKQSISDSVSSPIHLTHPLLNLSIYSDESKSMPALSYNCSDLAGLKEHLQQTGISYSVNTISGDQSQIKFYSPDSQFFLIRQSAE